jgi:hypothetical protein
MEMIRDALSPERLASMRKMLEALDGTAPKMERQMVPLRQKRDFEEEADRAAFERRKKERV